MKGKLTTYNIVLIVILVIALGLLFVENASAITGHATSDYTFSNVTIDYFLSIDMCDDLGDGIDFGTVSTLGVDNYNASNNYVGASNLTTYCINVSTDGNVPVDFCLRANAGLTDPVGGAVIGLGNESYHAINVTSDINNPSLASEIAMTTTYRHAVNHTSPGNASYWRFWLDMPFGQEAGSYNNTVTFRGVSTGTVTCGV